MSCRSLLVFHLNWLKFTSVSSDLGGGQAPWFLVDKNQLLDLMATSRGMGSCGVPFPFLNHLVISKVTMQRIQMVLNVKATALQSPLWPACVTCHLSVESPNPGKGTLWNPSGNV